MKDLLKENYIKKNITKEWLQSNHFRYNKSYSDHEENVYTYRFPVYKYGCCVTLEAEILIFVNSGEVRINVYDSHTRNKYAPFYYREYGEYSTVINTINDKILKEFKKLGIEEIKYEN